MMSHFAAAARDRLAQNSQLTAAAFTATVLLAQAGTVAAQGNCGGIIGP